MDTAVRFMLASIALLAIVNHAHANTGRDDAEVVLEAGEIDSSTVAVGAFVVVVYERDEPPQSLSGAWAKLDTTRGYIKAVDRQGLLLSLKGWPQRIALDRIQTLTLSHKAAYGRAMRRLPETPDRFSVITDDMGSIKRIAIKLFSGAALGGVSAYLGEPSVGGSKAVKRIAYSTELPLWAWQLAIQPGHLSRLLWHDFGTYVYILQ